MKELDIVKLKHNCKCDDSKKIIPKGTTGTIVHAYSGHQVFLVEFNDNEILTLKDTDITLVTPCKK